MATAATPAQLDWLIDQLDKTIRTLIVGRSVAYRPYSAQDQLIEATCQAELCSVYNLPLSEFATKQLRSKPRQRWDMDYSVGGPLWREWQRLQTHSEWEKWKDMYGKEDTVAVHPFRWGLLYDWLLENDLPLEAEEVKRCRLEEYIEAPKKHQLSPPSWRPASVNESSDSEPVEGAA